jgi:mRNA interferase HigB
MKVRLIKKSTIQNYIYRNKAGYISFNGWMDKLKLADWRLPSDIRNHFKGSDLLGRGSNRVIFDIGGNDYRMICKYQFCRNEVRLYVCWIGTHDDYDKLCSFNMQFHVNYY